LPLPDGAAAAAVATWVLQYTDDPARAAAELARVARERVVIVQAAPANDLVEVYNLEAALAGSPPAHHGWLLATAADVLERRGFAVELRPVPTPVRFPDGGPAALAQIPGPPPLRRSPAGAGDGGDHRAAPGRVRGPRRGRRRRRAAGRAALISPSRRAAAG